MVKTEGSKEMLIKQNKRKFCGNRGKFINFEGKRGKFIIFLEIGEMQYAPLA